MDTDALLGRMTLDEKVGQLFLLAFDASQLEAAEVLFERHFVGGSYLSNENLPDPASAVAMTRRIQGLAARTRLGIPVLLGADQEGAWSVMYPDSCPGPGNMALGATGSPTQARAMYEVIGQELVAVGVDAMFAPCADCNTNPANAIIGVRSFGERPDRVADMTEAAVEGALAAGAIPTLKHFPGHGDTTVDSHRGLPTVARPRDDLFAIDLLPFGRGIAAGAPIVMTAHILFPALDPERPATLSPVILQDVLRGDLGFGGVVLSDSMNMKAMRSNYDPVTAALAAIGAGVDVLMLAEEHYDHDAGYLDRQVAIIEGVLAAIKEGRLREARVDAAVGRVLHLKERLAASPSLDPGAVGSPAHREVELAAARAAVAVLRGADDLLPLAAGRPLTVVNATRREAYGVLGSTRGIGPNQTDAAFDLFAGWLCSRAAQARIVSAEEVLGGSAVGEEELVVAVTENHPLPGIDFDQRDRTRILEMLCRRPGRTLVVALRDPYELADLPFVADYLCAFGSRWCSAQAAAEVLLGEARARGASPVSVPGAGIVAR
jgi:beta-N-acetylhexosaminidase